MDDLKASVVQSTENGLLGVRQKFAIAAVSCAVAVLVIDGNIANVALPTIARELNVAPAQVTSVITIYQLVQLTFLLPLASVADRVGHKRLFSSGLLLFLIASALCIFASTFPLLILLRALQGLGAGMVMAVNVALLRATYPSSKLGAGLGLNSVIVAMAASIAPTIGGFLLAHFSWQFVFASAVPLTLPALFFASSLPDGERGRHGANANAGIWSALTLLVLVGGIQFLAHSGSVAIGGVMVLGGAFSSYWLVRHERNSTQPVVPVDLLKVPVIGFSALGSLSGFVAVGALMISFPFRMERAFHFTPPEVGLLLLPFPLTLLVVSPLAGWISDRVSPSKMGIAGLAVAIAGLLALAWLPPQPGPLDVCTRLALCALGFGFFLPPNSRLLVGSAPMRRSAAAGSLLSTARLLGQTLAAALMGILLSLEVGFGPLPLYMAVGFAILAAICCMARFNKVRAAKRLSIEAGL